MKRPRHDGKLTRAPALGLFDVMRDVGESFHDAGGVAREPVVNDVDLLDARAARFEGQADVPVGLGATAEDCEGLDVGAAGEEAGGRERGAEGCECG